MYKKVITIPERFCLTKNGNKNIYFCFRCKLNIFYPVS